MCSSSSSVTIDNLDIKSIQQLNKRLELLLEHIKSIKSNSNVTNNLIIQIRIDLHQRYQLRNNYYHRKYPLVLRDLSRIKSTKTSFQLIEKHHSQSIQFFKKSFNSNIQSYHHQFEQSNKYLTELKTTVNQYENDINQLKQELIDQTNQIYLHSNNLFQIQYEQNQIQSTIKQLKQQILFEKELHQQEIPIDNNLQNLLTQITQIEFSIKQKRFELLPLQFKADVYRTLINTNKTRTVLVPTTNTEEINHQPALLINKIDENKSKSNQQQLPIEFDIKSKKSKIIESV
jgi:archaellum component FlaC